MSLIAAKCTQCGANITVDETKEAGICEYCGAAFITEKAINNYNITNNINVSNATINVSGVDIDNLLLRAKQYEDIGDEDKAIEYYNRILDIDATHPIATEKVFNLKKIYIGNTVVAKEQLAQITMLVAKGEKITAIKMVRDFTGLGLAEAKAFVDNINSINIHKPQNLTQYTSTTTGTTGNKSGGCYVATCVYGSYDCPEVWTLRRFRDNKLAGTMFGRAFIKTYYAISPTIVKWFGDTHSFKSFWKKHLNKLVEKLQNEGYESTPYND